MFILPLVNFAYFRQIPTVIILSVPKIKSNPLFNTSISKNNRLFYYLRYIPTLFVCDMPALAILATNHTSQLFSYSSNQNSNPKATLFYQAQHFHRERQKSNAFCSYGRLGKYLVHLKPNP